jgi:ribosomal subunit interface protein
VKDGGVSKSYGGSRGAKGLASRRQAASGGENMNFNIEFKGFAPQKEIQKVIQDLIKRIEKKTKGFSPEVVYLRLMVEENSVRTLYRVSVTLEVPGKILATKEERHDLDETIRDAFAEIERQLEAHKATLRGEHLWKQRPRREELHKRR